jgi:cell division protein FtsQ
LIRLLDGRSRASEPSPDEPDDDAVLDPRIEARRRAVRQARAARRRRRWLALSVVVTVVVVAYGLAHSAAFDVDDVVVTGAVRAPADAVAARTGVRVGQPMVEVDGSAAGAAVEVLPWVASATVSRSWWGRVDVAVTERTAVVVLTGDGPDSALVDATGRVLDVTTTPPDGLPRVRGLDLVPAGATVDPRLDGALRFLAALTPGVRTRVAAVVVRGDEYDLALRPVGTARLGPADHIEAKVLALRTMFGQVELAGACVLDVRVPDSPGLTRGEPCG